jgi:3-methyladenine DNA glycosylase/8-oxoguanine DNA glycosylase
MHEKAVQHLSRSDRILGRLIAKVGPCALRPDRKQTPFEALVEAVAHQQLTGKAARTILGRVKALHPGRQFPTPEDFLATPDEKLRAAGLSRGKIKSIRDISARTLEGVVPTPREMSRMEDMEIIERLTTIHGVGQWTVEMLLIFKLGRPDVLPVNDYGVRKGFAVTYRKADLPKAADLLAHGERWRPHRSVAAWYMWRAIELARRAE